MNVSNLNRYLLVDSTYVNIFSFFVTALSFKNELNA